MRDRRIEYMPLDDILRAERNPKDHDVELLAESFDRFGLVEVPTLDERTGRLVAGHGRLDTLQRARADGTPPDDVDVDESGVWWVPVSRGWSSTDDDHAAAAGIALNRAPEIGGWHPTELAAELDRLRHTDGGLIGLGFDADDLDTLLSSITVEPAAADEQPTGEPVPFADFPTAVPTDLVDFRFGDYSAKVSRRVYDAFVEQFEQQREQTDAVLLDDVLVGWLAL